MKIERLISCFDIKTEKLIREYNIDNIDFETLKEIIKPNKNDPLMYNPYKIKKNQVDKLEKLVDMKFDLGNYIYQVDCFQI
ncbi:hypothetical protein FACS1894203_5540 [Bacteroidia bacterium]|nr:hypothetical protein FACS1894203_5540 [Bacteroidia bacterium]